MDIRSRHVRRGLVAVLAVACLQLAGTAAAGVAPGTSGKDTIAGTPQADQLNGRGGNDTIDGGRGNDTLAGGKGRDFLEGGRGGDSVNARDGLTVQPDARQHFLGWGDDCSGIFDFTCTVLIPLRSDAIVSATWDPDLT